MRDNKLTREAYEDFQKKLDLLKKKRTEISRLIEAAREHGDLRENSSYHEAKREQSLNEMNITDVEDIITNAIITEYKDSSKAVVKVGSTVKLKNPDNKEVDEYKLVSELEADIFQNKISVTSLLGKAILNRKLNEVVEFTAPKGKVRYEILEIS